MGVGVGRGRCLALQAGDATLERDPSRCRRLAPQPEGGGKLEQAWVGLGLGLGLG